MNKHKILYPQALKAIANEANFFLYQIVDLGPGKKPNKVPATMGKPWVSANTDRAAVHTLEEVIEVRDVYNANPDRIAKHNAERKEYAEKVDREYLPILRYEVGYIPREGSAAVVVDLDDCVTPDGLEFDDFALMAAVEAFGGYKEVSTSGKGLRLLMPRGFGDTDRSDRREANGCAFMAQAEKAKGFALTLTGEGSFIRDDDLIEEVCRVRDSGLKTKGVERDIDETDVDEVVLEFLEYDLDDLRAMLEAYTNDGIDRDQWVGLMKAVKEAFEPRFGDEAFEVFDDWTASAGDHAHDEDHNRRIWDEPISKGSKSRTTMASILREARDNGWTSASEDEAEINETPTAEPEIERYVLINGKFYDTLLHEILDASQMYRLSIEWDMRLKGKPVKMQNQRLAWLAENLTPYTGIGFKPGLGVTYEGVGGVWLNTWAPVPIVPSGKAPTIWLDHVKHLYPADWEVIVDWLAFVIQNPGKKVGFAPILIGPEGCGKDTIVWPVTEFLDDYANPEVKMSLAAGQFGDWLNRKLLCIIQENTRGRFTDKAAVAEHFKTMITSPPDKLTIEPKGGKPVKIDNVVNVVFLMNHADAIYVEPGSRRYYPVATDDKPDVQYFDRLWGWLHAGGKHEVIAWLAGKKVTKVRANMDAPKSAHLDEVIAANLPPNADAVFDYVEGRNWVTLQQVMGAIYAEAEGKPMSAAALGRIMKAAGFFKVVRSGSDRGRWSVKVDGVSTHYTVFSRPGVTPVEEAIIEALKADGEVLERSQKGPPLRAIK